jgi:hypothetical protein
MKKYEEIWDTFLKNHNSRKARCSKHRPLLTHWPELQSSNLPLPKNIFWGTQSRSFPMAANQTILWTHEIVSSLSCLGTAGRNKKQRLLLKRQTITMACPSQSCHIVCLQELSILIMAMTIPSLHSCCRKVHLYTQVSSDVMITRMSAKRGMRRIWKSNKSVCVDFSGNKSHKDRPFLSMLNLEFWRSLLQMNGCLLISTATPCLVPAS